MKGYSPAYPETRREILGIHLPTLLGVIPVPAFIALTLVLYVILPRDHTPIFEPPFLLPILNTVFLSLASFIVAYIALRSYLSSGSPTILLLGCGTLAFKGSF